MQEAFPRLAHQRPCQPWKAHPRSWCPVVASFAGCWQMKFWWPMGLTQRLWLFPFRHNVVVVWCWWLDWFTWILCLLLQYHDLAWLLLLGFLVLAISGQHCPKHSLSVGVADSKCTSLWQKEVYTSAIAIIWYFCLLEPVPSNLPDIKIKSHEIIPWNCPGLLPMIYVSCLF